jgi:hypothetical protein
MKSLVLETVETLEVMDVPMPKLEPGLVLVEVSKCGTQLCSYLAPWDAWERTGRK